MRTPIGTGSLNRIADWLFGGTCYLCRGACGAGLLCAACAADLPRLPRPRCARCALPCAAETLCGRCLGETPAYDATVAVFEYGFPADVLVQGLKFRGELALAPLLADELAREVAAIGGQSADLVIPVPLHPARLAQRGYNQSMEIARGVAGRLQVPLEAGICARIRDTPAQIDLPFDDRRSNMRGAFSCRRTLDSMRVAVIDDVMTTGATLNEIAVTLKKSGASSVVNWVFARTPLD
jgi:ComF family protein